ncbi:MAG: alpha-2-macroglobulin family protein [Rubrivivax sp.]
MDKVQRCDRTVNGSAWALGLVAFGLLGAHAAAGAASIAAVSPQGEVAQVRQVVVKFDQPVVALGDGRQADPVRLQCNTGTPDGVGRWTSPQQWVYDVGTPLAPGTSCTLDAAAGWKPAAGPAAGSALTGRTRFSFRTGGPAVQRIQPAEGEVIEEDQHFLVLFTGAPTDASLTAQSWCEIEGIGERVPVQLVTGAARDAVIKAERLGEQARRAVLLRCQRPLPQDARMRLVFGPGIAALANPQATTREARRLQYSVRPAFSAEFTCERERAQAPCLPIRPLRVRFSEPVSREQAQQLRLKPAGGPSGGATPAAALSPVFDKDDTASEFSEVRFAVPLAEDARYTLELPKDLKSVSGRPLANAASFPLTVGTGAAPPLAKFAAAPFGILESQAEPVLPLTVRHVQGDLRPGASAGQVRVLRLDEPKALLQAYARVRRWHEQQLPAREAGLPKDRWTQTVTEKDEQGRLRTRVVDRWVGTRELSLLKGEAAARRLDLPVLQGGDPRPFEVVGIPLPQPGYHVVEVESSRLGAALLEQASGKPTAPMYVRTGVLVTNLAVHVKLAAKGGMVWVTTLDRARPVPGAEVDILNCQADSVWRGKTDAQGRALITEALKPVRPPGGACVADNAYFVTARKADEQGRPDISFAFSNWNEGIDPWRFNLPLADRSEPSTLRAHTVFDRTLLRAGETVSMKHFVREETLQGLKALAPALLPTRARLTHEGSNREIVLPLQWQGSRNATSRWDIPAQAPLGRWRVTLERDGSEPDYQRQWASGSLRVEEFRVPLVDARLAGPKAEPVAASDIALDVQMTYLSGGAMGRAPLSASALWRERSLQFDAYPEFSFQAPSDTGRGQQAEPADDDAEAGSRGAGIVVADRITLATSPEGAARWVVPRRAASAAQRRPGELRAEVSYADPNGETQTVSTRVATWPSAVVLGLRSSHWASTRGDVTLSAVALDTQGKPLKGQRVEVRARLSQTLSTRKRMVGGFYAYDNRVQTRELGTVCSGSTDAQGLLACTAKLDNAGEIELIARTQDSAGRPAEAATQVWVTRQGELWFAQGNDDRIDVLPEKRRYEPGETARLQVRMPYREATALVAIEREGIIDTRLVTLRGDDPTVSLKIEPDWGPNVYVSVLAVRGRIRDVPWYSFFEWGWKAPLEWARAFWVEGRQYQAPTAMVDLSKPSARFGVAALDIGRAAYELKVAVKADQSQYRIRDKARVTVQVTLPDGRPAAGAEVAFAAVDEGLLALQDNTSWDLLSALVQKRPWGVETATAMSEIIGRRHYGRKAVAAGGGGGRAGARELFDTLLLWNPRVTLDAQGQAVIEVPLNDSLTSHRLVAIADAGEQRFGHGQTSIRVTQDLQVLAGLPPLVREGDTYQAMLTVRNTTSRPLMLTASLSGTVVSPAGPGGNELQRRPLALPPQPLTLAANSAQELQWPVQVPDGAISIQWEAAVQEKGGPLQDRAKTVQLVKPAVPTRVLQATVLQLDGSASLPVQTPTDALLQPDGSPRGGLEVSAQARLGHALPGLRRYFEAYPYTCLEQQASRAIGLGDEAAFNTLVNAMPAYLDSDGLAAYFPPRAGDAPGGSDRLTAYLIGISHDRGWRLPPTLLDPMLQGLSQFVQGRIERRFWAPRADLEVRKLSALAALARHGRAEPAMLGSLRTGPEAVNQWPTAALIDWLTILQRVPTVPQRDARLAEAQQVLKARLQFAGTTLRFSQEDGDFWYWLMDSADANAARLMLAVMDDPAWRDDMPRLVLGHLARQKQGTWLTTTANAWSVVALERFAARFESAPVSGRSTAQLAGAPAAVLEWPATGTAGTAASGAAAAAGAANPRTLLAWPRSAGPSTLNLSHSGSGKPWVTVQSLAAIPLKEPLRRGYSLNRSLVVVEQKTAGQWARGDVVRVRLEVEALADMSWVVISDPVPAGATILGSGLGRDAGIATRGERREGQAWPAYEERGFEAFRSYYAFLPRGRHVVEYTLRLNNPGRFVLPPSRVEAMYAPESFGELPNLPLEVRP